jgi:hypothetical protein
MTCGRRGAKQDGIIIVEGIWKGSRLLQTDVNLYPTIGHCRHVASTNMSVYTRAGVTKQKENCRDSQAYSMSTSIGSLNVVLLVWHWPDIGLGNINVTNRRKRFSHHMLTTKRVALN